MNSSAILCLTTVFTFATIHAEAPTFVASPGNRPVPASSPASLSKDDQQMKALQDARTTAAADLSTALAKAPGSKERAAIATQFAQQEAQRQAQAEALMARQASSADLASTAPVSLPDNLPAPLRQAMTERNLIAQDSQAFLERTRTMKPAERSAAVTDWLEKTQARLQKNQADLSRQSDTATESAAPAIIDPPADTPPEIRDLLLARNARLRDFQSLQQRTAGLDSAARAQAYTQWSLKDSAQQQSQLPILEKAAATLEEKK